MAAPMLTTPATATGTAPGGRGRPSRRRRVREALTGYLFITPQAIGFTLFVLVPLGAIVALSFTHTDLRSGRSEAAGWDNYRQLLAEDPTFWKSMAVTGVFALGLVAVNVTLSLALALVLFRRPPGAGLFLTLAFLSVVTSQAAWALVWRFLLQGEGGGVNELLSLVGGRGYLDVACYPFQIPLGALLPVRLDNLIAGGKCLGATHITNGCYRLHPVEWNTGEAAGALAAFALDNGVPPRAVRARAGLLGDFQAVLGKLGVPLAWPEAVRGVER